MSKKIPLKCTGMNAKKLLEILSSKESEIERVIIDTLLSTAFKNKYTLHPRKIRQIGKLEIQNLKEFLAGADEEQTYARGKDLAKTGLSWQSVLAVGTTLRNYFQEFLVAVNEAIKIPHLNHIFDQYFEAYTNRCCQYFNDNNIEVGFKNDNLVKRLLDAKEAKDTLKKKLYPRSLKEIKRERKVERKTKGS